MPLTVAISYILQYARRTRREAIQMLSLESGVTDAGRALSFWGEYARVLGFLYLKGPSGGVSEKREASAVGEVCAQC